MNIISNSCIGAEIYRKGLNVPFSNPFIWNIIDNENIIKLISNYDKINFLNYELHKDSHWNFWITIDNCIDIHLPHYHFDPNSEEITKRGNHIYHNRIWMYITEKYENRVARMIADNEPPLFILGTIHKHEQNFLTDDYIKRICKINTHYKILIVSDTRLSETKNVKFHRTSIKDDGKTSNLTLGREIYLEHLNLFRKSDDEIPLV